MLPTILPDRRHINDLTAPCVLHILSYLDARDLCFAAATQSAWREPCLYEVLWQRHLQQDFGLEEAAGPNGPLPTHRTAYGAWAGVFPVHCRAFAARAITAWSRIKAYLASHAPALLPTLLPGASDDAIHKAEELMGMDMPPALQAIYRVHNGQLSHTQMRLEARQAAAAQKQQAKEAAAAAAAAGATLPELTSQSHGPQRSAADSHGRGSDSKESNDEEEEESEGAEDSEEEEDSEGGEDSEEEWHASMQPAALGTALFGGISFYDTFMVTRMASLEDAFVPAATDPPGEEQQKRMFLAAGMVMGDMMHAPRGVLVDWPSGGVSHLGGVPATPALPSGGSLRDGVLCWLEEYARRLAAGWYQPSACLLGQQPPLLPGICTFPCQPPAMSSAVTRGVQVQASAVLVVAHGRMDGVQGRPPKYHFAYRVNFRLLSTEEQQARCLPSTAGHFRPITSAQLTHRHWVIKGPEGGVVDEVRGEGVVGEYPILHAGGPTFSYQSCTMQDTIRGFMGGSFGFVEGTRAQPTGGAFQAACADFPLTMDTYLY